MAKAEHEELEIVEWCHGGVVRVKLPLDVLLCSPCKKTKFTLMLPDFVNK